MADADINININAKNNTRRAFADFGMILTGFNSALAIARQAVETFKKVYEFSEQGAQLERLETASYDMARSIGMDMDEILAATREASLGMVSNTEIMASANKAMMLGVGQSAEDMANLMEVAAVRGRVMGLDTQKAFEDLVTGIGRKSNLKLDNLGIVLDLNVAYDEYAETLGKTAKSLTEAEKKQAILNAVIEDTQPLLEETGGLMLDSAGKFEQLQAAEKNYWDQVKKNQASAFDGWNEFWTNTFGNMEDAAKETEALQTAIDRMYDAFNAGDVTSAQKNMVLFLASFAPDRAGFINDYLENIYGLGDALSTAEKSALDYYASFVEGDDAVINSTPLLEDYATAINEIETQYKEAADAVRNDLIGAIKDLEKAQTSWKEGVASDLTSTFIKMAEDAGLSTDEIIKRLGLVDEQFGTQKAYEFELNLKTDELAALLLSDPEAFMAQAQQFEDYFMPLEQAVADAQALVDDLQKQLTDLERTYIVRIQTLILGAGISAAGGGGGGGFNLPQQRASGGSVYAGVPYEINEHGPEMFVPKENGAIIPNGVRQGGGGNITVVINTPVNLADEVFVERKLYPYIKQGIQQAMRGG